MSRNLFSSRSRIGVVLILALAGFDATAQTPREFNACAVVTLEDATAALGAAAEAEPVNPKAKPSKFVPACTYTGTLDGKSQTVNVQFRFHRSATEAVANLKETRLEVRGRPLILAGQDAYWDPKQAHLVVSKGSAQLFITVGPAKESERQPEPARKLAERLLPKLS